MTDASTMKADLLIELGCEELPPKALDAIREAFFVGVHDGLVKSGLAFDTKGSCSWSSPRRLALCFRQVAASQPDQVIERRGPAVSAAFDEQGKPTGAALGFARSVGMDVAELETLKTDKGEWLFTSINQTGKTLDELILPILETVVKQLPVPKPMRWSDNEFSFIRPVHWFVLIHGGRIIPCRLLGQHSGNETRGHRIHSPGPHTIPTAHDYLGVLERACVVADHERRRDRIQEMLTSAEDHVHIDSDLLTEVNNLVEWPVAVSCTFDEAFLEVPHEALIASMQDHQKFFPVWNAAKPGRVTNRFVAVSNVDSTDPDAVRAGYERVIRPRLADAQFFLEQDRKIPLEEYLGRLDRVVFQQKIGTVGNKSKRMSAISLKLADMLSFDPELSSRAARLSKCDLVTHMVGEFPELQGVMGGHYARSSGESPEVAEAISEHYAPRFSGDDIPASHAGRIISIADRLDTLVGIFAAGLKPSGNKDPFALRRAALGLIRILLEARLELALDRLLAVAANEVSIQLEVDSETLLGVRHFIVERLRHHYRELGFSTELVNAVLASAWDTLPDLDRRLRALDGFMGKDAAKSLAAANKRIGNILKKAESEKIGNIDEDGFVLEEERSLFEEVVKLESQVAPLLRQRDYKASLLLLAALREPVDRFFDTVMVMDKDQALRINRLSLLHRLKTLFDGIADLSVLA